MTAGWAAGVFDFVFARIHIADNDERSIGTGLQFQGKLVKRVLASIVRAKAAWSFSKVHSPQSISLTQGGGNAGT